MRLFGLHITRSKSKKRSFEAADKGRRAKAFKGANSTGANREISGALVTIRNRARHMGRNNGWAKRAIEAITKHTIGEGIQPAPVGGLTQTQPVKNLWKSWACTTACDWYGKTTFYGLQEIAMRSIAESGEVLILKRWAKPEEFCTIPLKLQVLEGDHLDHTRDGKNEKGTARLGVQFDNNGLLIGYWLFDYHPGEIITFGKKIESSYFDKSDVLHVYEVLRPGQVRGLPMGVASFIKMGDFSDFEDATLFKQKIAACLSVFITSSEEDDDNSDGDIDLEPGGIYRMRPGENVEFSDPPSANDFDSYSARTLQGIAASYSITYEMLTMDYSKVNFTSGRMAKIDVTQNFKSWQYHIIVPQLCAPVWNWFISACLITGDLSGYMAADWTAPRIQQLDPVKEVSANATAVKNGLSTLSEIIRESGREPEEFFAEYAQDLKRLKELGITIQSINTGLPHETGKGDSIIQPGGY